MAVEHWWYDVYAQTNFCLNENQKKNILYISYRITYATCLGSFNLYSRVMKAAIVTRINPPKKALSV